MNLDQATAAAGTIQIGGRTLLMHRLTFHDHGQVTAWLKERIKPPFQAAAEALRDLHPLKELDPEAYEATRRELIREADAINRSGNPLYDPVAAKFALSSYDGVTFVLWLTIRHGQPDVTLEWVREVCVDESPGTLKRKIDLAAGLIEEAVTGSPQTPQTETGRPTGGK